MNIVSKLVHTFLRPGKSMFSKFINIQSAYIAVQERVVYLCDTYMSMKIFAIRQFDQFDQFDQFNKFQQLQQF